MKEVKGTSFVPIKSLVAESGGPPGTFGYQNAGQLIVLFEAANLIKLSG